MAPVARSDVVVGSEQPAVDVAKVIPPEPDPPALVRFRSVPYVPLTEVTVNAIA